METEKPLNRPFAICTRCGRYEYDANRTGDPCKRETLVVDKRVTCKGNLRSTATDSFDADGRLIRKQ
jgi:hypothetical protein